MKKFVFLSVTAMLVLSACSKGSTSISLENMNPITASRYETELADTLANFIIQKEEFTQSPETTKKIQKFISDAKYRLADADDLYAEGAKGAMITIKAAVNGYALLLKNTLYFSSDFETKPGVDLHVYLTEAVDPRDIEFPDTTAVDLGVIQSAYGAQTYNVPRTKNSDALRTVVLWDKEFGLLYSFGQLSK